jgi:hypothetical protein
MGFLDKIKDLAKGHKTEVNEGIAKAGDIADQKTGNKYAEQIDKAEHAVEDQLGTDE